MKDRIPTPGKSGLVTLTRADGSVLLGTLARADSAIEPGMPLDRLHFIPDAVQARYGGSDPSPADLFLKLAPAQFAGRPFIGKSNTTVNGNAETLHSTATATLTAVADPLGTLRTTGKPYHYIVPPERVAGMAVAVSMRWGSQSFASTTISASFGGVTKSENGPPVHTDGTLQDDVVLFYFDVSAASAPRELVLRVNADGHNYNGTVDLARAVCLSVRVDFW